jgi:hypothetical protein
MMRGLLIAATVAIVAVAVWSQPPEGYICGKVFWHVGSDSGASYSWVWRKKVGTGDWTRTEANCCGKYALRSLESGAYYDVYAQHVVNIADPCPHQGSGCDTTVTTDTVRVQASDMDVDFYLGIYDCRNSQTPCPNPCPI